MYSDLQGLIGKVIWCTVACIAAYQLWAITSPVDFRTGTFRYNLATAPSQRDGKDIIKQARERWIAASAEDVNNSIFYATPEDWRDSSPGELLKFEHVLDSEAAQRYGHPAGVTMFRLYYISVNGKNESVPATAAVFVPYSPAQWGREQFRTVAWSHGTTGLSRDCAPSLMSFVAYDFNGPFTLAMSGYVVVAPDYAGLGPVGQFNYMNANEHASDMANAVVATRKALGSLTTHEWAAIGHSEGGLTAWATNQQQSHTPVGGFLGSVAIAPVLQPAKWPAWFLETPEGNSKLGPSGSMYYTVWMLEAIGRMFPGLKPSHYLSKEANTRQQAILEGGCYMAGSDGFMNLSLNEVWTDLSWLHSPETAAWAKNVGGNSDVQLAGPVLVIQSLTDEAVVPAINLETVNNYCEAFGTSSSVQYSEYHGVGHDQTPYVSTGEWSSFLGDLFERRKFNVGCVRKTTASVLERPNVVANYQLQLL